MAGKRHSDEDVLKLLRQIELKLTAGDKLSDLSEDRIASAKDNFLAGLGECFNRKALSFPHVSNVIAARAQLMESAIQTLKGGFSRQMAGAWDINTWLGLAQKGCFQPKAVARKVSAAALLQGFLKISTQLSSMCSAFSLKIAGNVEISQ